MVRGLRLITAAWLFAIALLAAPTLAAAQAEAPAWSLKLWPGMATVLATREIGQRPVVLRTIQCTNGDPKVTSRRFLLPEAPDPEGVQLCGAYCRMRLAQTLPQGTVIPDRYTEAELSIRALRRTLAAELAAEIAAEPWRDRDDGRLLLLLQMADACRLELPATIGQGHWAPVASDAVIGGPALPTIYDLSARSRTLRPVTKPTTPESIAEPLILRLIGEVLKGSAAVSLRDAQGHAVAPEIILSTADGPVALFFELNPAMPPVHVAVRNNDDDTKGAAFLVRSIDAAPKSRFGAEDLIDLKAALDGQTVGRPNREGFPAD